MNIICFIGRTTKDVEIKETASGKSVGRFSVAVPRKFKDANGEKQADFIPCVAWGQKAGFIAHHFKKGDMICITGELQSSTYEKDGQKRTSLEVNVAEADFCGDNNRGSMQKAPSKPLEVPEEVSEPLDDADLPFEL
jgi:single-strand DNA-binding protein